MYKLIIFLFIACIFVDIQAQDPINQTMMDTSKNQEILIGQCDRNGLQHPVFKEFWDIYYTAYEANTLILEKLMSYAGTYSVYIVLGSWCGDSQEQVPRFYKIADQIGLEDIEVMAVNRKKSAPGFESIIDPLSIEKVPTFIILIGSVEVGRIIETPTVSLEEDLLRILEKL